MTIDECHALLHDARINCTPQTVTYRIVATSYRKNSPMPAHLVDVLSADEIFDLLTYFEAGGVRGHPAYKR